MTTQPPEPMKDQPNEKGAQHSPEPWKIVSPAEWSDGCWKILISDNDGNYYGIRGATKDRLEANAARIVECVNFCAKFENENLQLRAQLDEARKFESWVKRNEAFSITHAHDCRITSYKLAKCTCGLSALLSQKQSTKGARNGKKD